MDTVIVYLLTPFLLSVGDHSGGLGGDHVLCDGCSFLLQLHLLHSTDHCKSHSYIYSIGSVHRAALYV